MEEAAPCSSTDEGRAATAREVVATAAAAAMDDMNFLRSNAMEWLHVSNDVQMTEFTAFYPPIPLPNPRISGRLRIVLATLRIFAVTERCKSG